MKGYVNKLIEDYPQMVRERKHLEQQIKRCEFLSADELIGAMCFSHANGERVQNSELSDRTAQVAICYQEKLERINEELLVPMKKRYEALNDEIVFLEEAIGKLPEELSQIMQALVLQGITWDELEFSSCMNRRTISQYRKRGIDCLVREYQKRASHMEVLLLS